ncbi:MAG: imidazole glycerol phosphate synthase subunit HisH [Bacteroidota bacterium]|nr:imidazole glycerol phosphate synthase subunit HisH [Bacteroidota bacterium]
MAVAIIDYGLCNLGSVKRAFEENGAEAYITKNPSELADATHIVLPGVGAFPDAMANLEKDGMVEAIRENVVEYKIPFLGICLGMQLMCQFGLEVVMTEGINLVPGEVIPFPDTLKNIRVPHIGWNEVHLLNNSVLFYKIPNGTDFYFVHSYHCSKIPQENVIATTPHGYDFISAFQQDNIFGVQFHPEKSSKAGFQLIKNFIHYF